MNDGTSALNLTPMPLEGIVITSDDPAGLVSLDTTQRTVLDFFTDPAVVPAVLEAVGKVARDFTPDLSTDKGRKAIASQAFKVAKTKTFLDELGKDEVARLKELPKTVDAARKLLRDGLDSIKDQIRDPLTAWEAHQKEMEARISSIRNLPSTLFTAPSARIQEAITSLGSMPLDEAAWGDHLKEARSAHMVTVPTLEEMLEKALKLEAEAAELARLREEKAARDRADREEALRREGEERARLKAEEEARRAASQVQPQNPGPLTGKGLAPSAPAPAPQTTVAQQVQAPAPVSAPGECASCPTIPAELEHRRSFNREALAGLLTCLNGDEDTAKAVLTAIVQGKVPHVSITY